MTIKEAFEQLSATVKKGMKNPFFVMRNLSDKLGEIADEIEGGGGSGSTVVVDPILTEGTKIATITVDDTPKDLYAPAGGIIYSTNERVVGKWIDGKPLYEKSFNLPSTITMNNISWTSTGVSISNIKNIVDGSLNRNGSQNFACSFRADNSVIEIQTYFDGTQCNTESVVTIKYTKTTD